METKEINCQNCGERFIPTVHKTYQKYCKKCGVIAREKKKRLNYQTRRNFHTTIRINTTERTIIRKYGINLSKLVREVLYKYDRALKEVKVV